MLNPVEQLLVIVELKFLHDWLIADLTLLGRVRVRQKVVSIDKLRGNKERDAQQDVDEEALTSL